MASTLKFEPVPQYTEQFQSTDHATDSPRPLVKWKYGKVAGLLGDLLLILVSCIFLVYAFMAVAFDGTSVEGSAEVLLLERASNLGPTIYPILFAAVVGKALRSIALWKLEKGGALGFFDQILGSATITQTIKTQIAMRTPNVVGLLLIVVWALSPLGSQASLRIISTELRNSSVSSTVQYLNASSNGLQQYSQGSISSQTAPVNILFGAAIIHPPATLDGWGNLRVPSIEHLNQTSTQADGWLSVPSNMTSDHYASLIGLPLSSISRNATTEFNLETSYWILDCPIYGNGTQLNATAKGVYGSVNIRIHSNTTRAVDKSDSSQVQMTKGDPPREINYSDGQQTYANCSMHTSFVELGVSCTSGACFAFRIRRSRNPSLPPENWSVLDTKSDSFLRYALPFVDAFPSVHPASPSPFQSFMKDPYSPFTGMAIQKPMEPLPIYINNATFALRFGQLLNTFWMALLAPTAIPRGLQNDNFPSSIGDVRGASYQDSPATIITNREVLVYNRFWVAVLTISASVTALLGVCGILATVLANGPEIGFNLSSMVKDNPFVRQSVGSSVLDAAEISRACKNIIVRYGDVKGDEQVGYIAVGSIDQVRTLEDTKSGRLYQ